MKNQNEQNLIGHLEEMRTRIIRTLIAFLVSMAAAFIYVRDIYHWLVRDMDQKLVVLGPSDVMWVYFMIAGVVAIAVTFRLPLIRHGNSCSPQCRSKPTSDFAIYTKHHLVVSDSESLLGISFCFRWFFIYE